MADATPTDDGVVVIGAAAGAGSGAGAGGGAAAGVSGMVVSDGPDADLIRAMLAGAAAGSGTAPIFGGGGGLGDVAGGETLVCEPELTVASLGEGGVWRVVRPVADGGGIADSADGLRLSTLPGSVWGAFGRSNPARNVLVHREDLWKVASGDGGAVTRLAVELTVDLTPATFGEQAGLFWYAADDAWVKLVVEGKKAEAGGGAMVVLAVALPGQEPEVKTKADVSGSCHTLRLEVNAGTGVVAGMLKTPAYLRLLGQCDAAPVLSNDAARLAVAAHGGSEDPVNAATVSQLRVLSIASNRIEMGMDAGKMAAASSGLAATEAAADASGTSRADKA